MYFYKNVYVAVDGSKQSDSAFEKALSVCKRNLGASLKAIHIIDKGYRMQVAKLANDGAVNDIERRSTELEARYKEKAQAENIPFEMRVKEGSPSAVLIKEISGLTEDDLIMCGSSSLGTIGRLLLGSVSTNIMNHAICDVLVVRTPGHLQEIE